MSDVEMDAAASTATGAATELPTTPVPATTADGTADGHALAPMDVTDEELSACIAVLEKFHTPDGLAHFQSPKFKRLRTALMPMLADVRKKFFHGKSVDDDEKRQEKKRKIKVERARQKALDQQFINNTTLRAERLARLATLTAANPLLAYVPDGAVSSHRLLTQEANVEMVNSAETTASVNGDSDTREHEPAAVTSSSVPELHHHRACYTCKLKFKQLHHFYDQLCPSCAALNYEKRLQTADLKDHVAIITGARVKIGYEITLKLLRAGATVIATTRFPKDAAFRFARENDFDDWKHRLQVYGMDFRDLGVIDKFMDHVEKTFGTLDILINNATQTIRRPVHYYKHLITSEVAPIPEEFAQAEQILRGNANLLGLTSSESSSMPAAEPKAASASEGAIVSASNRASAVVASVTSAATPSSVLLSQVVLVPEDEESKDTAHLFPQGQVDTNNQQVDLRTSNSWVQKIDQIETMGTSFALNLLSSSVVLMCVCRCLLQSWWRCSRSTRWRRSSSTSAPSRYSRRYRRLHSAIAIMSLPLIS